MVRICNFTTMDREQSQTSETFPSVQRIISIKTAFVKKAQCVMHSTIRIKRKIHVYLEKIWKLHRVMPTCNSYTVRKLTWVHKFETNLGNIRASQETHMYLHIPLILPPFREGRHMVEEDKGHWRVFYYYIMFYIFLFYF